MTAYPVDDVDATAHGRSRDVAALWCNAPALEKRADRREMHTGSEGRL